MEDCSFGSESFEYLEVNNFKSHKMHYVTIASCLCNLGWVVLEKWFVIYTTLHELLR